MTVQARISLTDMPDWPARMKAPVAAAYMGVSQSTFLTRYGDQGVKEGANTFWARAQLDRIVAEQFNLKSDAGASPVKTAYDEWKAGREG
jgi:hypothetical protein